MKVLKKEKLPQSKIKLLIEVLADDLNKFINQAFEQLKKEIKIPGFRTGKAPNFLIEKEIGTQKLQNKILEIALPNTYYQAIKENNILPLEAPEVKLIKFIPDNCLVYEAVVTVVPEIDLGDYKKSLKKAKIKKSPVKVDDKQIEAVIKNLQKQRAKFLKVLREARKDDKVEIDFEGFVEGRPIPEGSSQNHPLILGSGVMIPGFEKALYGMKKGEEKEFEIELPANFRIKNLASKKATFKVKMKEVYEVQLPQVDNQFARLLGHKDVNDLKKAIKESLEKEFTQRVEAEFEENLINHLINLVKIEIPDLLVVEELKFMKEDLEKRLSEIGLTLTGYLGQIKKSAEEFEKDLRPEAQKRVKIALILNKIAEIEKIIVTDKEVKEQIKEILSKAPPKDKQSLSQNLESPEQKRYIKNVIRNRKTIEFLKKIARSDS